MENLKITVSYTAELEIGQIEAMALEGRTKEFRASLLANCEKAIDQAAKDSLRGWTDGYRNQLRKLLDPAPELVEDVG